MAGRPNKKWRETMIKKLGSEEALSQYVKDMAAKGGKSAKKVDPITGKALKGFAVNKELARTAGKIGRRKRYDG